MKKIISIITIIMILGSSLTACSTTQIDKPQNSETNDNFKTETITQEIEPNEASSILTKQYEDQSVGFKVKYPLWSSESYYSLDYLMSRNGDGDGVEGGKASLIFSKYRVSDYHKFDEENIDIAAIKTSEDILEHMFEYKATNLYGNATSIRESTEEYEVLDTITVDGCEATKFKGSITLISSETYQVTYQLVGYAILGANRPIIIWASDESEEQNQYDELSDLVDAIVQTFEDGE